MQTQVMFYLLDENEQFHTTQDKVSPFYPVCLHACHQAAKFYRNNQKVFIYTKNQEDAHEIDEMLWAFEPDSFVPHNLTGEGPRGGAAVEISWQMPTSRRPILINLTSTVPNFAGQFSTIIDFVPAEETLKQQARERFRTCRQWGFAVNNQAVPEIITKSTTVQ